MLIDWFTVIAQIINFLILIWLLKRFLYQPILKAIDERENRITSQLAEAENTMNEANRQKDEYQHKNVMFDQQYKQMMDEATDKVKQKHEEMMDEARKEYNDFRAKLHESLRHEKQVIDKEIKRRIHSEVYAIAEKLLTDLASKSLEEQMIEVFISKLEELTPEDQQGLVKAYKSSYRLITLRSAFELTDNQKVNIENTVQGIIKEPVNYQYEEEPEQISGIELRADGYKLSWSISEYLSVLQKDVADLMTTDQP